MERIAFEKEAARVSVGQIRNPGNYWNGDLEMADSAPKMDLGHAWQRAVSFAARKHQGQLRKDGETPYFAHPVRVAFIVRHLFNVADETAIQAALLHDTIEDTTTDYDDILEHFGKPVADAVAALTKDARLVHDEREATYDAQITRASWQARLVKLADVYDNYCDCTSDAQRKKFVSKAERAIVCAGNVPELQYAVKLVKELLGR